MLPGTRYTVENRAIPPGGRLLLYTDGLVEVFREDEEFGEERLLELFRDFPGRSAGAALGHLLRQLHEFTNTARQTDDMTALAVIRHRQGDPAT